MELIVPTFLAGMLTFLAPCTLPLVPVYLSVISGSITSEIKDSERTAIRRKTLVNGVFFIAGFSIVFILLGGLSVYIGRFVPGLRTFLSIFGGIFAITFGLSYLGVLNLDTFKKIGINIKPRKYENGSKISSFILGLSISFGWIPCSGPILTSIYALAVSNDGILSAFLLLIIFSLGLAVPFLILALMIGNTKKLTNFLIKNSKAINILSGILLIFIGVLLLMNDFGKIIEWGYVALDSIGYSNIIEHL